MIKEQLDQLIKESMMAKTSTRTLVLRAIKTKFMELETAKNAKPIDEIATLRKMISDRKNSAKIYRENNKIDLAVIEETEIEILKEFVPEEVSEETIRTLLSSISLEFNQKNMGSIMKQAKELIPNADMKLVGNIVKSMINNG